MGEGIGGIGGIIIGIIIVLFIVWLVISNIRIVPQANAYVIERLGAYNNTWQVGLHIKIPFIDRVARRVNLKETVLDFLPRPVITKDKVTLELDTVVWDQITEPKLYAYGVENPMSAVENLTATTLRNIIGELDLDATLTGRDYINSNIRSVLDEATDPWGIKINRVEVKNITPPREIQSAMEKQMKAEREKREAILRAEGEKRSSVLVAEGNKEVAILAAEAEKQAAILEAEAAKQAAIKRAEGEAEAIKMIQKATADGIEMIKLAEPSSQVITLKSFEALEKVANGHATKIIVPSEIQNLAGLVTSVSELAKK